MRAARPRWGDHRPLRGARSSGGGARTSSVGAFLRPDALAGAAGALLAGLGDVLILGRAVSGPDFDRAVGAVPDHVVHDPTWRSLWNGAALSRRRIWAGTLCGVVGIPFLAATGLRPSAPGVEEDVLHRVAIASVGAFALSGVLTHLCCGTVILAHQKELTAGVEVHAARRSSAEPATRLLSVSAVASLASLAVLSGCSAVAGLRGRGDAARLSPLMSPLACVVATLLTFGRLPAPVGGYARPASVSTGLLLHFCLTAATEVGCRRHEMTTEVPPWR